MTPQPPVPDPDGFAGDLHARTSKINESLEALEIKVDLWSSGEPGPFRALLDELRQDEAALLDAARRVTSAGGDEWHDLAARIMRALERLEGAVQTAWADFEVEIADDVDTYRAASARQMESWRGQVDRVRLHAKLAEMEARSAVGDMEQAFDAARPELERAKDAAGEALDALRDSGREFIMHLRRASQEASRRVR